MSSAYLARLISLISVRLFRKLSFAYFDNPLSQIVILLFIINFYSIGLINIIIEYAILYSIICDSYLKGFGSSGPTITGDDQPGGGQPGGPPTGNEPSGQQLLPFSIMQCPFSVQVLVILSVYG